MTDKKLVVGLYIRVSTERQAKEGDSLVEQEKELKKFCEYRGFQIYKVYIEKGRSGGNTNRPEYQSLLGDVSKGRISAVVVKKLDRLSRSLLDFEEFMKLLQEKDVEFISLRENFDTTSAMGKATLRVALVFAQLEREQTSERLIDIMGHRASQGLFNGGKPAYGYINANKELVPYPKEKKIVEVMFNEFSRSKSTTETARFLNETGYRTRKGSLWDKRRIWEMLKNPIYIGKVKWNNKEFQGIHAPIITEKQFKTAQLLLKMNKNLSITSKTKGIIQKLIFCGHCKHAMTPSHALNRAKVRYYYYRCTSTNHSEKGASSCPVKYLPFKVAEDTVFNLLLSLSEEANFSIIESRVFKHNQVIEKELKVLEQKIQELNRSYEEIKLKKDRYFDSLITGNFTSAEREKISTRINEIELEEKQIRGNLFKQELELNKRKDDCINLSYLKRSFITFKTEFGSMSKSKLREYLIQNINRIYYHPERLVVSFKNIPFEIPFKI
ncbi:recombinase family protein [Candidatus Margulisiibacteriota bacterium]